MPMSSRVVGSSAFGGATSRVAPCVFGCLLLLVGCKAERGARTDDNREMTAPTSSPVPIDGTAVVPCQPDEACRADADCAPTCENGTDASPSDTDGTKNNGETDTDCGGPNAKRCGTGKACLSNDDCGFGYCAFDACVAPSATDEIRNGTETDVDCGGAAQTDQGVTIPAAPRCAPAQTCAEDLDCASTVCADNHRCVEAPSCRAVHGGQTCGAGEFGEPGAQQESCCKSLPVPGVTMVKDGETKQVYLDKYEITAGRVRAWLAAIKATYGGVPNIQAWVKSRMETDAILAAMFPAPAPQRPPLGPPDTADYLPVGAWGQPVTFPYLEGGNVALDMGLQSQIGPTSYLRGVQQSGISGCGMYADSYGHRTYWFDDAEADEFGELHRPAGQREWLDEKSMNCMTPIMFAAFCAWDGGYMASQAAWFSAWGDKVWPWGDGPDVTDDAAKLANFNAGTGTFSPSAPPRYVFPSVDYGTFAADFSPIIAAPGRFSGDKASVVRPNQETWMDMGGNMLEWTQSAGVYYGWSGSSFEGHRYFRSGTSPLHFLDKYGKGSTRCMRLM